MLVKQLVGRYAGDVVEFPYAIAMEKLKNKTAVLPNDEAGHDEVADEPKPKRRGRPRKSTNAE